MKVEEYQVLTCKHYIVCSVSTQTRMNEDRHRTAKVSARQSGSSGSTVL